jgi:hypothetical protein
MGLTPQLIQDACRRVAHAAERQVFGDDMTITPEKIERCKKLAREGMARIEAAAREDGIDVQIETEAR